MRPRPYWSCRVCLALLCTIVRPARTMHSGGCRVPAARPFLPSIATQRPAGGGALSPARPGAAPARCPGGLFRLRGGGILKKLAKGLPMNLEEKKYWDMAKRGELHRLLQTDSGKKSRRDLAILRKKARRRTLALPPAAQERLAAQIADKARSNPLLADKGSAMARFSARSLHSARKGGRPDVWQDNKGRMRKGALPKSNQVPAIRDGRPGLSANDRANPDGQGAKIGVEGEVPSVQDSSKKVGWRFVEAQNIKRRGEEEWLLKRSQEE